MRRSASRSRNGLASAPTRSPAWRPTTGSPGRRRWRPRSSAACPPGRTGYSTGPTPLVLTARCAASAPASGPSSTGSESDVTTTADYTEKIPNNVSLHEDRRLQRALESWQPNFLTWWQTMGPTLPTQDVYLRTAVNVGREGWAQFGHVPMPEYRWGIFLAERDPGRRGGFGELNGEPVWAEVPGE